MPVNFDLSFDSKKIKMFQGDRIGTLLAKIDRVFKINFIALN